MRRFPSGSGGDTIPEWILSAVRSALEEPTLDLLPLRVAAGSSAMTPLQFEPGSKYQYSNAGINTAGRIIEVVSGMPYEGFLQ